MPVWCLYVKLLFQSVESRFNDLRSSQTVAPDQSPDLRSLLSSKIQKDLTVVILAVSLALRFELWVALFVQTVRHRICIMIRASASRHWFELRVLAGASLCDHDKHVEIDDFVLVFSAVVVSRESNRRWLQPYLNFVGQTWSWFRAIPGRAYTWWPRWIRFWWWWDTRIFQTTVVFCGLKHLTVVEHHVWIECTVPECWLYRIGIERWEHVVSVRKLHFILDQLLL